MSGFGFIMTMFVIWFWLNPDRAGAWAAKAKRAFLDACPSEEQSDG